MGKQARLRRWTLALAAALSVGACATSDQRASQDATFAYADDQTASVGDQGLHGTHGTGAIPLVSGTGSDDYRRHAEPAREASAPGWIYQVTPDPAPAARDGMAFSARGWSRQTGTAPYVRATTGVLPRRFGTPYIARTVPVIGVVPSVPFEYNTGQVDSPTGRLVFGPHNLADQGVRGGGFDAHVPPPRLFLGFGTAFHPLFGF